MSKFLSDEFFNDLQRALSGDAKWTESTMGVKTTILMKATGTGEGHLLSVNEGTTSIQRAQEGTTAEFSFEGSYDAWSKVAKGEMDMQSAVLKGQLKFEGSITKILMYRDRFMRIAELMKDIQKEF